MAVALNAFYDEVEARVESGGSGKIVVEEVRGPYAEHVKNPTTVVGAFEVLKSHFGYRFANDVDVVIRLFKGVPIGVGLGSSGASAAATVVALSNLFSLGLGPSDLVYMAGLAEGYAAGTPHFDNVAASVLGKLVTLAILDKGLAVKRIDFDAWFAIAMPTKNIFGEGKTKAMREVLPKAIDLRKAVANWSRLAVMIASAMQGDLETFGKMMELDDVVEPARARLIPCYSEVRAAAKKAGGLGVAISGAGPSMIALARGESHAREVANAMAEAYSKCVEAVAIVAKTAQEAHIIYST